MSRYISNKIKRLVIDRAHKSCEYCLAYEDFSFSKFQIEHIISLKHGGTSKLENLALACFYCNNRKGTDLGTMIDSKLTRFYHPRNDKWLEHFEITGSLILPKTKIGNSTITILEFNDEKRVSERNALLSTNNFPFRETLNLLK